jgi:hypothetical protein
VIREAGLPSLFIEDLGDEALEVRDGDLDRFPVLVGEPCGETNLEPAEDEGVVTGSEVFSKSRLAANPQGDEGVPCMGERVGVAKKGV